MAAMGIRVVVVDDQDLIRGGVVAILQHTPDIEVVGDAADGAAGVELVRRLRPDIVLMDIRMPVLDGIAATREIAADPELASVRVVILTTFEGDAEVLGALHAGASGFLGKGAAPAELVAAVRTVAEGASLLSPAATRAVIAHVAAEQVIAGPDPSALRELTERDARWSRWSGVACRTTRSPRNSWCRR